MDGLASLLLVATLAASLAAFGFWAWRESARSGGQATDEPASALPPRRTAQSKVETAESASAQDDDPALRNGKCGCPSSGPPDNAAAASISLGVGDSPVLPPEIVLLAPQQQPVKGDPLQAPTQEDSVAPPAPPPTDVGGRSDGQAEKPLPHDGEVAGAESEERADGHAAEGPALDPGGQPAAEAQPEAVEAPLLPTASNLAAPDIMSGAGAADAVDDSATAAGPADAVQIDALEDHPVATDAALPSFSAEPQVQGDECADDAARSSGPLEPENELESAAASDHEEQGETDTQAPLQDPTSEGMPPSLRPMQPAIHRDRRGGRRVSSPVKTPVAPGPTARPPAEAKMRLSLHPIRRTARVSVVLMRPDGFPERIQIGDETVVEAYDAQRYDDLDLPWSCKLLDGELRITSTDGFQWVRSRRQVHIFAADPNEPDLISVGAARLGVEHALVCRSSDTTDIRSAAASAGSPDMQAHEHWQGIPDGWMVLSGYTPAQAVTRPLPTGLRPLDPGTGLEIVLKGGLAIRPRVYAEGHPPRILISPSQGSHSITIGAQPATLSADGAWEAPGWDAPGQHMVDVVPGPSASYEIAADPWAIAGWDFWDAHSDRFENRSPGRPWTRAEICGAQLRGPAGEAVFAAETQPTLIALGLRSGASPLLRRGDVSVSVGFMAEAPAFLLAATGQRRTQGRVVWLGLTPASQSSRRVDPDWVAGIRAATSRRLPLDRSDALGEDAWRKAKERARRLKRPRT